MKQHRPCEVEPSAESRTPNGAVMELEELAGQEQIWFTRDLTPEFHDDVLACCAAAAEPLN